MRTHLLHCSCWMARWARRGPAVAMLAVLTVAHPLLHPFEGGALDGVILALTAWVAATDE